MGRHCGFCLIEIPSEKVLRCGKCHRRAYCGKICQQTDWFSKEGGQGHKNWCELNCCEEDIDWSVLPIKGKGLGVIAQKVIPSKSRIIVEANCSPKHPGLKDLLPTNGTLAQKYKLNSLGCGVYDDVDEVICLRISRVNHSCDPNAGHIYDSTFKVKVLFAEREIKIGEEICISYRTFKDNMRGNEIAQETRNLLETVWNIVCPEDCHCQDKEIERILMESKRLDSEILTLGSIGQIKPGLKKVKQLLKNKEIIRCGFQTQIQTLYDGFQLGVMKRETIQVGLDFIQQAYQIQSSILHPQSEGTEQYKNWFTKPQLHHDFLRYDGFKESQKEQQQSGKRIDGSIGLSFVLFLIILLLAAIIKDSNVFI